MTKTKNYKKIRPKIRLKAWKNGEVVIDTTRRSKRRLQAILRSQRRFDKYYLKVTYGKGLTNQGIEDIYNEAYCFTKSELLNDLSVFTSKDEMNDFVENFSVEKEGGGV